MYSEPGQTSKMEVFVKKVRVRRQIVLGQLTLTRNLHDLHYNSEYSTAFSLLYNDVHKQAHKQEFSGQRRFIRIRKLQ